PRPPPPPFEAEEPAPIPPAVLSSAVLGPEPPPEPIVADGVPGAVPGVGLFGLAMPTVGEEVVSFDPAATSVPVRFASGPIAKRPRASPKGILNGSSGGAGVGLRASNGSVGLSSAAFTGASAGFGAGSGGFGGSGGLGTS